MQVDNTAGKQHGVIVGVSCSSPVFAILSGGTSPSMHLIFLRFSFNTGKAGIMLVSASQCGCEFLMT